MQISDRLLGRLLQAGEEILLVLLRGLMRRAVAVSPGKACDGTGGVPRPVMAQMPKPLVRCCASWRVARGHRHAGMLPDLRTLGSVPIAGTQRRRRSIAGGNARLGTRLVTEKAL